MRTLFKYFKILKLRLLLVLCIIWLPGLFNESKAITKSVGIAGNYTTIQLAFADINTSSNGMTGAITLNIISDITETVFPIELNTNTVTATYTSVLIQPQGGAWTISGNRNGYFISFKGASDVTIDGLNTGGNALTLENTYVFGGGLTSTVGFNTGAHDILIQNCTIKGKIKRFGGTYTSGIILFTPGFNHDIIITNCDLTASSAAAAGTPFNIIYSIQNDYNVTISNNNISNYHNDGSFGSSEYSHGISVNSPAPGTIGTGGTQSWVIDNNKFFQTVARTKTSDGIEGAIYVRNTFSSTFGVDITNNVIGHTASVGSMDMTYNYTGGSKMPSFLPIYVTNLATGTTTNIKGNTIAGISFTTTANGQAGVNPYWFNHNCPGIFTALAVHETGVATPTVNIGGTAANRADGNIIGMAGYPISVTASANSSVTMAGIWSGYAGTSYIQNNTIANWSLSETGTGSITMSGIALGNSTPYAPAINGYCTGNQIYNLDMVSGNAGTISGIRQISSSSPAGWSVSNNIISLSSTYVGAQLNGIYEANVNTGTIINSYYYNSVYIGGTGSAGTTSNGIVFPCGGCGTVTNNLINNIFYMDRNGAGTAYSINHSVSLPLIVPDVWNSNYNIFINTQSTIIGREIVSPWTFAQWQANTGGDANSYSGITPIFFTNVATGDLHITWDMSTVYPGTPLASAGTYPLGVDYDDPQTRAIIPDIGADEFGPSILPVEMLSFAGVASDNRVDLFWKTAMELNCDYYQIERSEEGKHFKPIGTVKGAGNSSSEQFYKFTDYELPSEVSALYYRLFQTDYDGGGEYFGPIKIKTTHQGDWDLILKNNQAEEFQVVISSPEGGTFLITMMNVHGQTVYSREYSAEKGLNSVQIDLGEFSTGMYFLRVNNSRKTLVGKVIHR